ncbi:hypothetical protein BC567DRAFT_225841 [Phyllosticta citribraziliensis]
MLTTGHALLIRGFNVQLDTHAEAHAVAGGRQSNMHLSSKNTSLVVSPAASILFLSMSFPPAALLVRFRPAHDLCSFGPARFSLPNADPARELAPSVSVRSFPPSTPRPPRRRRADQTRPDPSQGTSNVDTRTARVLPSDRGPSAAVTASGKSARGRRRDMLTETPCG